MSAAIKMSDQLQREDLLAELRQKENDLVLAAQFGKNLLEEKERLQQDLSALRADLACLEEVLESQKQESLKSKKLAEEHVSELEAELDGCRSCLELERMTAASAREEFRRSCRQLHEENSQLKDHLAQVKEQHAFRLEELTTRLMETREHGEIVSVDCEHTHHSLQRLQGQNQSLDRNLSTVSRSCERLTLELEDSRDMAGFWENQYHSQEELLHSQAKELDDSKNQLRQLQMQLDQKHLQGVMTSRESVSSGMSLYDELSQLDEVEQHDENTSMVSYSSDNDSCMEDEKVLTLRPVAKSSLTGDAMEDHKRGGTGTKSQESETSPHTRVCQRCQELEVENERLEAELGSLNEQLLLAVKQKFKLQQQIEDWQCDMAAVVESRLQQKLAKEKRRWSKSKFEKDVSDGHTGGNKTSSRSRLSQIILKDSWLF